MLEFHAYALRKNMHEHPRERLDDNACKMYKFFFISSSTTSVEPCHRRLNDVIWLRSFVIPTKSNDKPLIRILERPESLLILT